MPPPKETFEFEQQVRSAARSLWNTDSGTSIVIDGRERDCVFFGEELINYIECTVSRTLSKVRTDAEKMVRFRREQGERGNLVKLWMITKDEPTADQAAEARRHKIQIISLAQFQKRVFDVEQYYQHRKQYPFGSATNPRTDTPDVEDVKYQATALRGESAALNGNASSIIEMLAKKEVITILGDYGMGKSLLVRELFMHTAKECLKSGRPPFPIAINLRDHWGQTDPHEVLHRHAFKLGFPKPDQLIRAYNAGLLIIFLDGFDEPGYLLDSGGPNL